MLFKETITYTVRYLPKSIVINGRSINQINISSHCDKHKKEGVTNEKIVELAELLDKGEFEIDGEDNKKIYFKTYHLYENKTYKLVWWWWLDKDYSTLYVRTCHPIKIIN